MFENASFKMVLDKPRQKNFSLDMCLKFEELNFKVGPVSSSSVSFLVCVCLNYQFPTSIGDFVPCITAIKTMWTNIETKLLGVQAHLKAEALLPWLNYQTPF